MRLAWSFGAAIGLLVGALLSGVRLALPEPGAPPASWPAAILLSAEPAAVSPAEPWPAVPAVPAVPARALPAAPAAGKALTPTDSGMGDTRPHVAAAAPARADAERRDPALTPARRPPLLTADNPPPGPGTPALRARIPPPPPCCGWDPPRPERALSASGR